MTRDTEAGLLADSAAYLAELRTSGRLGAASPRICHHFFPLDGAPPDAYLPELPELLVQIDPSALIDFIGDPVGIELWQMIEPNGDQLSRQIRLFYSAAASCSAAYAGWSYEPQRDEINGS